MTKEEIKFQCLRVAQDNQYHYLDHFMIDKEDQPKWKDVEQILTDAQKVYDWVNRK